MMDDLDVMAAMSRLKRENIRLSKENEELRVKLFEMTGKFAEAANNQMPFALSVVDAVDTLRRREAAATTVEAEGR